MAIESWLLLLRIDLAMRFRGFAATYTLIRRQGVHLPPRHPFPSAEELCRAVDFACVFYFKQVLCLQRSAATAMLLRRRGWKADLVIGAQMMPFQSHAWVELDGQVVNDKPYVREIYRILDRLECAIVVREEQA